MLQVDYSFAVILIEGDNAGFLSFVCLVGLMLKASSHLVLRVYALLPKDVELPLVNPPCNCLDFTKHGIAFVRAWERGSRLVLSRGPPLWAFASMGPST